MVNYMSLEERVDADFARARRRTFLRRAEARLTNDLPSSSMPSFEEDRKRLASQGGGVRSGRRVVRIEQIVGSVGRSSQFDSWFMPAKRGLESRWKRIDRAFHRGVVLPAVSLYKLGESCYILDGNHRVSVARYHGVEIIEAEVVQFGFRLPKERLKSSAAYRPVDPRRYPKR